MKTPKLNFYLPRVLQSREIRVLCWIMTGPSNHYTKAVHIKKTWGAHCDKLIFMSSQEVSSKHVYWRGRTRSFVFNWSSWRVSGPRAGGGGTQHQ